MADGYGFGAEGDWKTAALVRAMKVMGEGLPGGTSFMEDYTYHLAPGGHQVLGAHMLEICPSIASTRPSLEDSPADHRRQGRPGSACLRHAARACPQRQPDRSGRPFPPAGERGRGGRPSRAAQAAGRARGLGMQARLQDRLRRLDPRRRRSSYRLQLQRDDRNARGFRRRSRTSSWSGSATASPCPA